MLASLIQSKKQFVKIYTANAVPERSINLRYNKNTKKVSPLAGKIYKECEESDMTVGEFLLLAEVLRNIHRRLVQVNNERKLNEYCNKVIVDALNQSSEKLEQ